MSSRFDWSAKYRIRQTIRNLIMIFFAQTLPTSPFSEADASGLFQPSTSFTMLLTNNQKVCYSQQCKWKPASFTMLSKMREILEISIEFPNVCGFTWKTLIGIILHTFCKRVCHFANTGKCKINRKLKCTEKM